MDAQQARPTEFQRLHAIIIHARDRGAFRPPFLAAQMRLVRLELDNGNSEAARRPMEAIDAEMRRLATTHPRYERLNTLVEALRKDYVAGLCGTYSPLNSVFLRAAHIDYKH